VLEPTTVDRYYRNFSDLRPSGKYAHTKQTGLHATLLTAQQAALTGRTCKKSWRYRRPRKIDTVFANYVRCYQIKPSKARTRWTRNPANSGWGRGAGDCLHKVRSMYPILYTCWSWSIGRCSSGRASTHPLRGARKHNSTHSVFLLSNFLSHLPAEFSHSSTLRSLTGVQDRVLILSSSSCVKLSRKQVP